MKQIVIVGAGYAGVLTAKQLAKRIHKSKKQAECTVTIIDRHPFHTMLTELHEVAAGRVEEDSVKIDLTRVFAKRDVNVVMDNVTSIDYEAKVVNAIRDRYSYDYLVMATGSRPAFFGVPGAEEHSFTLWSYEDAVKLQGHIINMFRLASCELDEGRRKELLTFCVAGAGFTGVEMAGELAECIPRLCERFSIEPSLVTILSVDLLDRACPVLPPKQSAKIERRLKKMGVDLHLRTNVSEVKADQLTIVDNQKNASTIKTQTVIWTAGVEGSQLAQDSKALEQAGRGRLATDDCLRSKNHENVFVAGDNIFYIPENETVPVPQMVENAEASAECVAHNIMADALGVGTPEKYKPAFHGVMVCVGGRYGSAHVGLPGRFFSLASFFAMFAKHFINLIYFIKVLGWNKIAAYMNHEFFTIKDRRSFVGGHFSNQSATFFLVPLRMYLGFYWIYEGVKKASEGWLAGPQLTGYFNGANQFYENILAAANGMAVSAATGTTAAADAATAATGAATSAAEATSGVLLNLNILGLARALLVQGSDIAFKLQIGMMDWFLDAFVMRSSPMQNFMQYFIVLSEILIGLALLGGLFTTLSGAYSLALQFMFITTTGIYMSTWWMPIAGLAVMFGAGRVFSLDYYVMPVLKKYWKRVGFARKWYLYND